MAFFMDKNDVYELGIISKLHGYQGKLILSLKNIEEPNFKSVKSIWFEIDNILTPFSLLNTQKLKKNKLIIQLLSVNSSNALSFLKRKAYVSKKEINVQSVHDKIKFLGYTIKDQNDSSIGQVEDFIDIKNNSLIQTNINGNEVLIPYNEEILLDLNETKQIIKLHIPEGLIELNFE